MPGPTVRTTSFAREKVTCIAYAALAFTSPTARRWQASGEEEHSVLVRYTDIPSMRRFRSIALRERARDHDRRT